MRQSQRPRPISVRVSVWVMRIATMVVVAALLFTSIVGGLLRAGVPFPTPSSSIWPGQAVLAHAFLMICAFLGTVIALERAVASKERLAFLAPIVSTSAGVAALAGAMPLASWLGAGAAFIFVLVNVALFQRQRVPHIAVLLVGAVAWFVGTLLFALGDGMLATTAIPWWFAFLVLTIAGERLEMTRLMRRHKGAAETLYVLLGCLLLGSAVFVVSPGAGAFVFGAALFGLSIWLACLDIARRTLASEGLSRYMAVGLLLGYAWLGIAGVAWMATALGYPLRDLALHALGIGFVFSMMLAHAPVILPALARIKVLFGWHFYVPLALLHASLAVRVAGPLNFEFLSVGAAGNALAIAVFLLTMLASALLWRVRHSSRQHEVPAHH